MRRGDPLMPSGTDPGAGDRAALFGAIRAAVCFFDHEIFVAEPAFPGPAPAHVNGPETVADEEDHHGRV
ncbi:hypothetical protein [Methylobacterium sp. J-077]|uniref:hypothetical protein n=1 Tax=Methylobacterium sp. J-077 TaxID=2836656 RepID=UPI001FBA5B4D|nr:hypothetical protein [Methylobacterium sp. J-077]MCJ2127115.1 hypothetical protein [Methylobacterium sp. J-077]